MRILFLLCMIILVPVLLPAQVQKAGERLSYASSYQFGMIVGKAYTTYGLQMVHGVRYKNYELGAGVALDPYGFRTIPVFGHLAYVLKPGKSSAYVWGDAGASIPWNYGAIPEKQMGTNLEWHKLYSGFYGEAGIGYRIKIDNRSAITFSGGYSFKRFRYTENTYVWNGSTSSPQKDWYVFDYHRLTFRIGIAF